MRTLESEAGSSGAPKVACFSDIPSEVLLLILRQLPAESLAALAVQDNSLRKASTLPELWAPICRQRWSFVSNADHYGGDWAALYSSRLRLPANVPIYIDSAVHKQQAFQLQPTYSQAVTSHNFFEVFLEALFKVTLVANQQDSVKESPDYQLLMGLAIWWLKNWPQVIVGYVRELCQRLLDSDARHFDENDAAWKRSALAFLLDVANGAGLAVHPSVISRFAHQLSSLDATMRHHSKQWAKPVQAQRLPRGLPSSHWWYFTYPGSLCMCYDS